MLKFIDIPLIESLKKNLLALGYEVPTPIQAQAIPVLLDGSDVLGVAQTGTGKTAAYSLPIIHKLLLTPQKRGVGMPRALILAPTRELAYQISVEIESFSKGLDLKTVVIFGGVAQGLQVQAIKSGVDILVATPGRLLDLIAQRYIQLGRIEIFTMDEADRMLDMGFIEDIQRVVEALPKVRQSLLFSATMPIVVQNLAHKILSKPKKIDVTPKQVTATKVEQRVILCKKMDKFQLLRKILKEEVTELVVIFTKTKNSADKVKEYLTFHRIAAGVLHGDKNQNERDLAINNFKTGQMKILIATDIAARGLDVLGVSHVINFELPLELESYVHRIGRTGRAGHAGTAITFCDETETEILERVQNFIRLKLPSETYKGSPEAKGIWASEGALVKKKKAPTPGKSQEKTAYLDHSKRQKIVTDGSPKPKAHPGFRGKKKK